MKMIEKIARAMCEYDVRDCPERFDIEWASEEQYYLGFAGAALLAMREPTDAMVEAVSIAEDKQGYVASAYETMHCAEAWPVMVDAAISEA